MTMTWEQFLFKLMCDHWNATIDDTTLLEMLSNRPDMIYFAQKQGFLPPTRREDAIEHAVGLVREAVPGIWNEINECLDSK